MRFVIDYSDDALRQLRNLAVRDQRLIATEINGQLSHQAIMETRNRKPLRDDLLLRWELRVGDFRVFYRVIETDNTVVVTAIGHKTHNRLFVEGKESEL